MNLIRKIEINENKSNDVYIYIIYINIYVYSWHIYLTHHMFLLYICYRENENLVHAKEKLELELKLSRAKSSSSSATSRLKDWIRRDEISEAYEFDSTYDGTIGKEALIFREAMINFVEDVKLELGSDFNEKKAVRKCKKH